MKESDLQNYLYRKLKRNRLQCRQCNDILESYYTHDFKRCTCGAVFIDGGLEYSRCGGTDLEQIIDLCEYEDIDTYTTEK